MKAQKPARKTHNIVAERKDDEVENEALQCRKGGVSVSMRRGAAAVKRKSSHPNASG